MLDNFGLAVTGATAENISLINQSAELLFRKNLVCSILECTERMKGNWK